MAVQNQNANPLIIEPAASSDLATPSTLLSPSLNTSSSSNSSDSSRPQSRGSSATSQSQSPSPGPEDVEPCEMTNIRPSPSPDRELLPPTRTVIPRERARSTTTPSINWPLQRAAGSSHSNGVASLSSYRPTVSRRSWLEHSLGLFGLVASLVGLLFIGVRTYKLAVISTENSTLDGCTGLIQAGFATLENSTQLCKTVMKAGPLSSPYHLDKRTWRSSLALATRWMEGRSEQTCGFPYIGCQPKLAEVGNRKISAPAILISTTLVLGGLILVIARRHARSTEVFTSPAYTDFHIIRDEGTGSNTVTGQGILERHDSEQHDLGEVHKQMRASFDKDRLIRDTAPLQSNDSPSTTLADGCRNSKISLKNGSTGEKHEGLVELQINRHTKAFFKLETGEFFHLKHWRHKHNDTSDSFDMNDNPLSVRERILRYLALAMSGPGAS